MKHQPNDSEFNKAVMSFAMEGAKSSLKDVGEHLITLGNQLLNAPRGHTEKGVLEADQVLVRHIEQLKFELQLLEEARAIQKYCSEKRIKLSK